MKFLRIYEVSPHIPTIDVSHPPGKQTATMHSTTILGISHQVEEEIVKITRTINAIHLQEAKIRHSTVRIDATPRTIQDYLLQYRDRQESSDLNSKILIFSVNS